MSRTLPQIVLLNHAASVNWKRNEWRAKLQVELDKAASDKQKQQDDKDPLVEFNGKRKRLSELTTDEYLAYYNTH